LVIRTSGSLDETENTVAWEQSAAKAGVIGQNQQDSLKEYYENPAALTICECMVEIPSQNALIAGFFQNRQPRSGFFSLPLFLYQRESPQSTTKKGHDKQAVHSSIDYP
jgi:hypothetical protein